MICTDLSIERANRARKFVERIRETRRDDVMREMSWTMGNGLSLDQGSVLGQVGAEDPPGILGSLAWRLRADLVHTATGVDVWPDQSGSVNFSESTPANQPTLITGAINGRPAVRGNGTAQKLSGTWTPPGTPSTNPIYIWAVVKQISWTNFDFLFGDYLDVSHGHALQSITSSPTLRVLQTGANTNSALTVGSYRRIEWQITGSASGYVKIGATQTSGADGNVVGSGVFQLFNAPASAANSNIEIAEIFAFMGTPTSPLRARLDAYCTGWYGTGLV